MAKNKNSNNNKKSVKTNNIKNDNANIVSDLQKENNIVDELKSGEKEQLNESDMNSKNDANTVSKKVSKKELKQGKNDAKSIRKNVVGALDGVRDDIKESIKEELEGYENASGIKDFVEPDSDEEDNVLNFFNKIFSISVVKLFISCLLIVLVIEIFGRHSVKDAFLFVLHEPCRYIMNAFLIMTPFTVFYISRRRKIGFCLVGFVWLFIGIVNGIVLAFRVTPFSTIDFRLWDDALMVIGKYFEPWMTVLLVVALVALFIGFIVFLFRLKKIEGKIHRIRNSFLIVCYWFSMYFIMKALVHAGLFTTNIPNLAYAYKDYGVCYCFTVTGMGNGMRRPIDYGKAKIDDINLDVDKALKKKDSKEPHKANIIFLQLESFFDIDYVKDYYFNEDPLPYFNYLKDNYSSGFLTVPAFGAGTANTEFEMMTGMKLNLFSPGEYPYKTVLKKRTAESIPYDLQKLGYSTHNIHNNTATFYGRSKVFTNLGYQTFSTIETMWSKDTTRTGWAKDRILTDEIIDALESTDSPDYVYTISVQGHGDYYKEEAQVDDPEVWVTGAGSKDQASAVNYYIEQIEEMDDFLEELTHKLNVFEEDVVLVLYGDHLPGLGFDNDSLENGDVFQTEYVIWSNFDMKVKDQDLMAYQLGAETLDRLNIHTGTITRYHQAKRGKKNYQANLRQLQYDILYGDMYSLNEENPFLQEDMTYGVKDVKINTVYRTDTRTIIYGENFTQFSKIYLNGEEVESELIGPSSMSFEQELNTGDKIQISQVTAKGKVLLSSHVYRYGGQTVPLEAVD
ncbi:MAG: LTA synthase family protein [Lachnospiraceae bacterium]|nr:LTA synthase family protein [Lachnospiraceae bacterium]